jgi:hypothetical protein
MSYEEEDSTACKVYLRMRRPQDEVDRHKHTHELIRRRPHNQVSLIR